MNPNAPAFYSQHGLLVQVYDNLTPAEWETSRNDVPFYLAEASIAAGPLLELGCGTGRLLIPLACTTGFEVQKVTRCTSRKSLEVPLRNASPG